MSEKEVLLAIMWLLTLICLFIQAYKNETYEYKIENLDKRVKTLEPKTKKVGRPKGSKNKKGM